MVTDASNSEGWPMELNAKDPTTNLYGLKVDDIYGFAEDGQAGTFTVTYTVCSNKKEDCLESLTNEDLKVAYKAGQCVALDDVAFEANSEEDEAPLTFIKWSLYPNPAQDLVNIEFTHANIGSELELKIVGLRGYTYYTGMVEITEENQVVSLPLTGIDPGVYFLTITSQHKVYTEKLIIE
jgi:hypothetical protein